MEKISIIVPVFNVQSYINECVQSIMMQTYGNIEIILVDNGSTDGSLKACIQLKESDQRIIVKHIEKSPTNTAVIEGIKIATGEFVVFVDSDDWISEDYISTLYLKIGDADGAKTSLAFVQENEIIYNTSGDNKVLNSEEIGTIIDDFFEKSGDISIVWGNSRCGKIYKMSKIKSIVSEMTKELYIGEDLELNLLFLSKCKKVIIDDRYHGYYVRKRNESITGHFFLKLPQYNADMIEALQRKKELFQKKGGYLKKLEKDVYWWSILFSLNDTDISVKKKKKVFLEEYVYRKAKKNRINVWRKIDRNRFVLFGPNYYILYGIKRLYTIVKKKVRLRK